MILLTMVWYSCNKKFPLFFFLLSGGPFAQICAFVFVRVHNAGSPGVE